MADNNLYKERLKILQEISRIKKSIDDFNIRGVDSGKSSYALGKEVKKTASQLLEINKKIALEQKKSFVDAQNSVSSLGSMYKGIKNLEQERLNLMVGQNGLSEKAVTRSNELASLNQRISQLTGDQSLEREVLNSEFEKELSMLSQQNNISEDVVSNLQSQHNIANGLATLTQKQKDLQQSHLDVLDNIHGIFSGILDTARQLTSGPLGFLGTTLIGAGFAMDKLAESAHELGTFTTESTLSATVMSTVFKDATGTVRGLSNEMGGVQAATFGTQLNANLLAHNLNLSGDEIGSLYGNFSRLNNGSTEMAESMITTTKEFAKQSGVIPGDVMKDVANSAKAFAEYGADGGKNIAQAAVQAAKLGVNMSTMTNVTDTLLDFESSITKELELGAMLGKNINFSKARQLAYDGKIGASVKDAIGQMGGIAAFNKMDIFQKRQAAEALGLSTEELSKMASNMDKLNDDGSIQLSKFQQSHEWLKMIATGPLGSVLKGLGGAAVAAGQMGFNVKGMVGDLAKGAKSLASKGWQMLSGRGGVASSAPSAPSSSGASVSDKLNKSSGGKGMKAGNMIKGAAAILILSAALFVAAKAFQEFGNVTWEAVSMGLVGLAGLAVIAYGLGKIQGEILKGALAVAVLGVALIPFAYAMSLIAGLEMSAVLAAAAGLGIFTAAVFGLGLLMMSGVGALLFGAGLVAIIALAGAIGLLSIASSGLESGANGLMMMGAGIALITKNLADLDIDKLNALSNFSMSMSISGALSGIASSISGVIDSVGGGESLSEYETTMLQKMDTLINEVKSNRDVYLDREKVTAVIKKQSERQPGNVFGLGAA